MQTFVRETDTLIHLYIDGEVISTTEEHPFWVPDLGWVEAGDLEVGMLLQTDEETFVDIDRIEEQDGEFEVYNFKVDDFHTYFVSDLEVLVHNICVYTTTNSRVDLNRPEGTYVTRQNLLDPVTLYRHISRNVPPTSKRRGQGFLDFVTEIDVPEKALEVDPGGIPNVTAWIPPNTDGARITREWRVRELEIGELPVFELIEK